MNILTLDGPNLVLNPSLESGTTIPDSWVSGINIPIGTICNRVWETAIAHTGTHSLSLEFPVLNTGVGYWSTRNFVPIDSTKQYRIGAWIYIPTNITEGAGGGGTNLSLEWWNALGYIDTNFVTWGNILASGWTYYEKIFGTVLNPIPSNVNGPATEVYFIPALENCSGKAYFDDFYIATYSACPTPIPNFTTS